MRVLVLRPEAKAEIRDAYRWYEQSRAGLGKVFGDAAYIRLIRIERTPLVYPRVHKDIRRALVRRFPYGVFYQPFITQIDVLSVMHTRRDPRRWKRRPRPWAQLADGQSRERKR
jgi:toxin ParE1/3/4